jgi:hypothetical protein
MKLMIKVFLNGFKNTAPAVRHIVNGGSKNETLKDGE